MGLRVLLAPGSRPYLRRRLIATRPSAPTGRAIGNNLPLDDIASLMARLCDWLIVEFVPKSDPKVKKLLSTRADIFADYTRQGFEAAFASHFSLVHSEPIRNSERRLYLMKR